MSGTSSGGDCASRVLVRIEGVDFDQAISDVNDLSTQRGAGLAFLAAPRALIAKAAREMGAEYEEVFTGASAGVYCLETHEAPEAVEDRIRILTANEAGTEKEAIGAAGKAETAAAELNAADDELEQRAATDDSKLWSRLRPLLPYLSFVVAAKRLGRGATKDCASAARLQLLARVRAAQLRQPTVPTPKPAKGAWRPCRLNTNLPASGADGLAASVRARRQFGRQQKRAFYKDPAYEIRFELSDDRIFARSLNDLVDPAPSFVKPNIYNKVAHLYLDGNDFGKIRECLIAKADGPLEAEREFSGRLKCLRGAMLSGLLSDLSALPDMTALHGHAEKRPGVFRWETLLWGGDEAAFVMPAWVALHVLSVLAEELSGPHWTMESTRLTHKIGIYIADRKTPIAVARKIAEALADSAKQGKPSANVAQLMVTESADPPMDVTDIGPDALARYRTRHFRCGDPAAFTLDLDEHLEDFVDGLKRVVAEPDGLPRSQLYGLLRDRTREVGSEDWRTNIRDAAFERSGAKCADVFCKPPFGPAPGGHPLLPFMRVAELLDYYCPEAWRNRGP